MNVDVRKQAIRQRIFGALTVIIDNNDREACEELNAAAQGALARYGVTTAAAMQESLRGNGLYDSRTLRDEVGAAAADVIRGWIAAETRTTTTRPLLMTVLSDLLDLSDSTMVLMLGHHYMPEPDDLPAAPAGDAR